MIRKEIERFCDDFREGLDAAFHSGNQLRPTGSQPTGLQLATALLVFVAIMLTGIVLAASLLAWFR